MKGELPNETVNYDKKIKICQFEPDVQVIKKSTPGKRTSLNRIFGGVPNKICFDCHRHIPTSAEKKQTYCHQNYHLSEKFNAVP